jgi:hypothetical protein
MLQLQVRLHDLRSSGRPRTSNEGILHRPRLSLSRSRLLLAEDAQAENRAGGNQASQFLGLFLHFLSN